MSDAQVASPPTSAPTSTPTSPPILYPINTDVSDAYLPELVEFINKRYVSKNASFSSVFSQTVNGTASLSFTVVNEAKMPIMSVEIVGGKPVMLKITKLDPSVQSKSVAALEQHTTIFVKLFEERVRDSTMVFGWREGKNAMPEKPNGGGEKRISKSFLELQVLLTAVILGVGIVFFFLIGWYAPLLMLALQLVFVVFFSRVITRIVDWRVTKDDPYISLIEYRLPLGDKEVFREKYSKETLRKIKEEVYLTSKSGASLDAVQKALAAHGISYNAQDVTTKRINVYDIVQRVADRFRFPVPKIVVANTSDANAAASGPSPKQGVVLITTGALTRLSETELLSVLGHEFGHLKGRDPLWLFGLMAFEFLVRFYVLLPLIPLLFENIFIFMLYFWGIMTVIFFIAKFFEARADLISAMVMGTPDALATALEKIGFKRLIMEEESSVRFQEWVGFDPHPPIYFRIKRMREFNPSKAIKHPLIQSARDVVNGFRSRNKK